MGLFGMIARWWRGKGFGIQSKSDYEYLKDVIKEKMAYYAYEDIKAKDAQLIYRICNHDKDRQVTMVGSFSNEEMTAAHRALGTEPETEDTLMHLHGRETVIVSDIRGENSFLWQLATHSKAITWDMGRLGLVRFLDKRYPEHYAI